MPETLQQYFQRLNPIRFGSPAPVSAIQEVKLVAAWDAFSRQLFTIAPRQLDRTRVYIDALSRIR